LQYRTLVLKALVLKIQRGLFMFVTCVKVTPSFSFTKTVSSSQVRSEGEMESSASIKFAAKAAFFMNSDGQHRAK